LAAVGAHDPELKGTMKPTDARDVPFTPPRWFWAYGLLLGALVVFAYQPVWNAGFIWDDDDYVINNSLLTAPDGLKRIWFSTDAPSQYFPLTYTTLRLERAVFGLNPAGYHWVNLFLHTANALLLAYLLLRLRIPGAWLAAAVFALHPVQVESVAWITELKNLQSLFFALLATVAWIQFAEAKDQKPLWYSLALGAFLLALFSKTTACTVPAAWLLIHWWRKEPLCLQRWIQVLPFFAAGLAMGLLTVWWEGHEQGTNAAQLNFTAVERLLIASRAVWFYLEKLLWPAALSFSYPQWPVDVASVASYGWPALCLVAACVLYIGARRGWRAPAAAFLFFVCTLGPLLGFFMLYTFRYSYVADHYQYVAMIGPVALLCAVLQRAADGVRWARPILAAGMLTVLASLTWQQSQIYKDLDSLWTATLQRNPSSDLAHNNLSALRVEQGRLDEAISLGRRALELEPHGADDALAHVNVGNALMKRGDLEGAQAEFEAALRIVPDLLHAHQNLAAVALQADRVEEAIDRLGKVIAVSPGNAHAHQNLGSAYFRKGAYDLAIGSYRRALETRPMDADVHNDLATALLLTGEVEAGLRHLQQALRYNPQLAKAHVNLGAVLLDRGEYAVALDHLRQAAILEPENVRTLSALSWALCSVPDLSLRNGGVALEHGRTAVALSQGNDPVALHAFAAALAETGDLASAGRVGRQALLLAQQQDNTALAAMIQALLVTFGDPAPLPSGNPAAAHLQGVPGGVGS
jgi:protein O-mannosyl-transferase